MKRVIKQIIIIAAVVLFLAAIVLGAIWFMRVRPTCFDGVKNGEEEGVDCGSACGVSCPTPGPTPVSLALNSVQVVQGGGKCDVVLAVSNPNNSLGADHIPYSVKWGTVQKQGEFYIYPSEERFVAEMNLPCQSGQDPQAEVKDPAKWSLFKGYEKPNLEISDSHFSYPESTYEFAEVGGIVTNHSPFDLKVVEIYAVVKDAKGAINAINRTTVNSLMVGEKREFRIFWTHTFPTNGTGFFYTTSNLFDSQNFLKNYSANSAKWSTENRNENENLNLDVNNNSAEVPQAVN